MIGFGKILGGVGLLALLFASGKASASSGTPADEPKNDEPPPADVPPFVLDAGREQAECQKAADEKPLTWDGRSRGVGQPLAAWLGWVALRRAYPAGPADPPAGDWQAALQRLTACVDVRLKQGGGGFELPKTDDKLPDISEVAKPGVFYRIKHKQTLLGPTGIIASAYGTQGAANLAAAQKVNAAQYNKRFWTSEFSEGEKDWWEKRISLLPKFGTFAQQQLDPQSGAEGKGNEFAVIWLPPANQVV